MGSTSRMSKQTASRASDRRNRGDHKRRSTRRRWHTLERLESRCVLAATIAGQAFNDLNGDQIWQKESPNFEPALDCWTVFLDSNRNGTLDPNEPNQLTASDGSYEFTVDDPGEYAVDLLPEPGFDRT